jgi:hypothetical protein
MKPLEYFSSIFFRDVYDIFTLRERVFGSTGDRFTIEDGGTYVDDNGDYYDRYIVGQVRPDNTSDKFAGFVITYDSRFNNHPIVSTHRNVMRVVDRFQNETIGGMT